MIAKLHEVLKPFLLRRVKDDVEKHLPAKQELVLYAPLSKAQRELQDSILKGELAAKMTELAKQNGGKRARSSYMRMVALRMCKHTDIWHSSLWH